MRMTPHGFTRPLDARSSDARTATCQLRTRVATPRALRHAGIAPSGRRRDRYLLVTSVAGVTGVAHALPRTAPVPGPSSAAETAPAALRTVAAPLIRRGHPAQCPPPSRSRPPRPRPPSRAAEPADAVAAPTRGPGRRELRRQETRARIVDAAAELFAERGFDAVSVMEIAKRAGVVEKTVFNHFPVKEGLVFDADPPMRAALLDAVRRRPVGRVGVRRRRQLRGVGDEHARVRPRRPTASRGWRGSSAAAASLQVREREILGELTDALADLIAEETGARRRGGRAVAGRARRPRPLRLAAGAGPRPGARRGRAAAS